jgi:hypothetical protein
MSAKIRLEPTGAISWFAKLLVLVVVSVGCAPVASRSTGPFQPFTGDPSQPFSLIVVNIDGPSVDVFLDGSFAAHADCAPRGVDTPPAVVSSAPLPWRIEVRRSDGSVFGSLVANASQGPLTLLVRTDGVSLIPRGQNIGPAPAASCTP